MTAATFDTLKFANTLRAGVPSQQAEAQAVAFAEVTQLNFKDLATKEDVALLRKDLDQVRTELRQEIALARQELRQEMNLVKHELSAKMDTMDAKRSGEIYLLKWMFGATFTVVLAVLWLVIRLSFAKFP